METNKRRQVGFSLIEAMLATGILGVGLVLIAMVFPVGIKLTSVAAERTIGTIAANEAFAKMKMWGLPTDLQWAKLPAGQNCLDYLTILNANHYKPTVWPPTGWPADWPKSLTWEEFLYPSAAEVTMDARRYHWSALCRKEGGSLVQTTVFLTRKVAPELRYYGWTCQEPSYSAPNLLITQNSDQRWPSPVLVDLRYQGDPRRLFVMNTPRWGQAAYSFFVENSVLVDDLNGRLYVVEEIAKTTVDRDTLILRDGWQWPGYEVDPTTPPTGTLTLRFWVVPPGIGSSRNPVVDVIQKTITSGN